MSDFDVQAGPGRVFVAGEIDTSVTAELREALGRAAAAARSAGVMVDLTRVTFLVSSGLNELLRGVHDGHQVTIRGATGPVRRLFELVGLDEVFELER